MQYYCNYYKKIMHGIACCTTTIIVFARIAFYEEVTRIAIIMSYYTILN